MPEGTQQQQRFWKELIELRGRVFYFQLYHIATERVDNALKIFLAIAANGSIAAWAVWSKAPMLWAGIVALAQLITVVKEYLPYQRRSKRLGNLISEFERIYLFAEGRWYDVSEGHLANREINGLIQEIKKRNLVAVDRHPDLFPLPQREKLKNEAKQRAEEYFQSLFA
ncbi:MAG: hypothetical protein GY856_43395 [bacterium]|nr:hypothetical protein [bacterium]